MKNLLTYLVWPTIAGLCFAGALLLAPWLATRIPALAAYMPASTAVATVVKPVAEVSYSAAIKKASPAVVSINSLSNVEHSAIRLSSFLRSYVVDTWNDQSNSLGSGVIIDKDGYIVTSYHVFFGTDPNTTTKDTKITVTLNDGNTLKGNTLEGNLVALDQRNDLALIKINKNNLPFLTISDSRNLDVGDVVLAIGNPRNIGQSVSSGIVSALWRKGDSFVIQTDAAINPGNSGGALIDVNGDLIGINSTIVSESGGSEGISFAIAAGKAMSLLHDYLFSPEEPLGMEVNALDVILGPGKKMQGLVINAVTPNGPADKAGLRKDDVIYGFGDQPIKIADINDRAEVGKIKSMIGSLPPGKLILINVLRDNQTLKVPTILGTGKPNNSSPHENPPATVKSR